jgi:hypothetical protein
MDPEPWFGFLFGPTGLLDISYHLGTAGGTFQINKIHTTQVVIQTDHGEFLSGKQAQAFQDVGADGHFVFIAVLIQGGVNAFGAIV